MENKFKEKNMSDVLYILLQKYLLLFPTSSRYIIITQRKYMVCKYLSIIGLIIIYNSLTHFISQVYMIIISVYQLSNCSFKHHVLLKTIDNFIYFKFSTILAKFIFRNRKKTVYEKDIFPLNCYFNCLHSTAVFIAVKLVIRILI